MKRYFFVNVILSSSPSGGGLRWGWVSKSYSKPILTPSLSLKERVYKEAAL
jgi:hypothetical protein